MIKIDIIVEFFFFFLWTQRPDGALPVATAFCFSEALPVELGRRRKAASVDRIKGTHIHIDLTCLPSCWGNTILNHSEHFAHKTKEMGSVLYCHNSQFSSVPLYT